MSASLGDDAVTASIADAERVLGRAHGRTRSILAACLEGHDLSVDDAVVLCGAQGADLHALCAVADLLRASQAGETVAYVINRNVNFTNVCVKACKFCAFSRVDRSEQAYFLSTEEIVRRVTQAHELGATEVCIQAGLPPDVDGRIYIDLCRAVKEAVPDIHVHAFSPEEIKYGASRAGMTFRDYLSELKAVGLGSLPGTSAEILDDRVRKRIAGGRITTSEWIDVVRTAHSLAIPTTSTIMFGHIESDAERMQHLALLRGLQRETRGFTEFVPLSFVHTEAPMYLKGMLPELDGGPSGNDVIRLFAISRLMLGADFKNIQASWVKEGIRQAQWLLSCGANDLGGTLMNESISTSAGAGHGQLMTPRELRKTIRDAGRIPVQRDTLYRPLREFGREPAENEDTSPLDQVRDSEAVFGLSLIHI